MPAMQIETAEGVSNAEEIMQVDGVDAVFVGMTGLAASAELIGRQAHPENVVSAVMSVVDPRSRLGPDR